MVEKERTRRDVCSTVQKTLWIVYVREERLREQSLLHRSESISAATLRFMDHSLTLSLTADSEKEERGKMKLWKNVLDGMKVTLNQVRGKT